MPIQPDKGAVHVSRPLTNISLAFLQKDDAFIADRVWPNIPVDKSSDTYYTFDRTFFMRDDMKERAVGAESQGTGFQVATSPYNCKLFALHFDIFDQVAANADSPINLDREGLNLLTQKALIKREKTWAAKALVGANWTLTRTGVASAPTGVQFIQWDQAASDPVKDVLRWKREIQITNFTGVRPNGLVIGQDTLDALMTNASIIDRLKYGQTAPGPVDVTLEGLRQMFKLDYLLVGSAVEVTSNEGAATATAASIIGKNGLIFYRPPAAGLMTPSSGYTFSWKGYHGMSEMGHRVSRFRMEWLKSDRLELEMAYDQSIVSKDLGTFLSGMVA